MKNNDAKNKRSSSNNYHKKSKKKILNDVNSDENLSKGINILNNYKEKIKEARSKIKGKTVMEYNEQLQTMAKSKMIKKNIVVCISIFAVVISIYLFFRFGPIFGISISRNLGIDEDNKISIVSTGDDIYLSYNNELLIYSNREVSTYNSSLKKTWTYSLEDTFTPNIYVCDKYMVISNNTNGKIYLFNGHKEILNKQVEGVINNIYLDKYGNMAIEYSSSGYKKIVGVYDKNGKHKYNTYFSNGAIVDIKILDKGNKLVVAQTDSSSFKVGFDILIVSGTEEGEIRQLATFDNNLLYNLTIQDENIIMLLDDKIASCNINNGTINNINTFKSDQMLFVGLAGNYYTYMSKDFSQDNSKYSVKMDRFDATNIGSMELDNTPKMMENTGILNYFIYQTNMQVINKWAIEVKSINIDFPPKQIVVFNHEKSVALIYTNKIYIVNL